MPCLQIFHRFYISEQLIIILVQNLLITFIQFITIAKDDIFGVIQSTMNIIVDCVIIFVLLSSGCIVETQ